MNRLADIHTHITPNVDDGSTSMEMSLEMLRTEAAQGGSSVFLTPHSGIFSSVTYRDIDAKMESIRQAAAEIDIPVQICKGCEIYTYGRNIEWNLQALEGGILTTIHSSVYCEGYNTATISGTEGCIVVDNTNNPGLIRIYSKGGRLQEEMAVPENISGYEYEFQACKDAMEKGLIEPPQMPHSETLFLMELMDSLRKEWGVRYPMDEG